MNSKGEESNHEHEDDNEWEQVKNDRDDHFDKEPEWIDDSDILKALEYTLYKDCDGDQIVSDSFTSSFWFALMPVVVEKHMKGIHEWKCKVIGVPSNKVFFQTRVVHSNLVHFS